MTRRGSADIAARYRDAMRAAADGELTEFPLTPYDRTGIPVEATVWDDGQGDAHGVGYGSTVEQASIGALGELAERTLMRPVLAALPSRRASFDELVREHGRDHVADPVELIIDAAAEYATDRPLSWVAGQRWRSGEQVWIPAEFAAFDSTSMPASAMRDGLITPITNGMGAGDTLERAVGHGLLELVQRDGDNVAFRALDRGEVIDLSGAEDPTIVAASAALRSAGIDVTVKLASTEFAVVTYCVGRDDDPDTPVLALGAIGEAAHPDRDVSVGKALLEFASSRARRIFAFGPTSLVAELNPDYWAAEQRRPVGEQEARALSEMAGWTDLTPAAMNEVLSPIFRRTSTVGLDTLPTRTVGTPEGLLDTMLERLAGFDVLVLATSGDEGMYAAKVLAPGLEVETMSYLRIGPRALDELLSRGSDLVGLGTGGPLPIRLSRSAKEAVGGPAWIDPAAVDRAIASLYPLYREPRRHAVQRTRSN